MGKHANQNAVKFPFSTDLNITIEFKPIFLERPLLRCSVNYVIYINLCFKNSHGQNLAGKGHVVVISAVLKSIMFGM